MIRRPLAALALVALLASSFAGEPKPGVSLVLLKASSERQEGEVVFRCEARLDNATGKELTVRTTFASAFDGLELVVTDRGGKTLAQQPYTSHQSPFSPSGREFTLKQGRTEAALVFPIRDLPAGVKEMKVRLVGTLPGSDFRRILSTETLEVKAKE